MVGGFFLTRDTLTPLISLQAGNVLPELEEEMLKQGVQVLEYAQTNAPWQDRTGNARRGLDVDVRREGTEIVLELYHTVDYGLWLEIKNSGEYAIIMPTLERFSQQVFDSVGAVETGGIDLA